MTDIIKYLSIAVTVGGIVFSVGKLWSKVEAHDVSVSKVEQMAIDIAVIKERVNYLYEHERQKLRR